MTNVKTRQPRLAHRIILFSLLISCAILSVKYFIKQTPSRSPPPPTPRPTPPKIPSSIQDSDSAESALEPETVKADVTVVSVDWDSDSGSIVEVDTKTGRPVKLSSRTAKPNNVIDDSDDDVVFMDFVNEHSDNDDINDAILKEDILKEDALKEDLKVSADIQPQSEDTEHLYAEQFHSALDLDSDYEFI